eukprot:GEMP01033506.1.p1 GENE.GEMP01033506.1~~GEMP01033506.1.p1  ORF type:complete len:364 (+),score=74.71 GEMP01033506.1:346-1437(+)
MARGCRPFAPVVRLCALLLLAPLDTWAATGEVKDAFLKIHNIYRCMHGVPEAEWDDKIAEGAQNFAAGSAYDAKSKQILSDPVVASEQKGSNAYLMNAGEAEEKHAREASAVFYYSIKLYDGNKWSPAVADAAKRASGNLGGQYDFMAFLGAMLWKPKQEIAYKIGCGTGVHDNNTVIVCRYQSPPPCIPNGRGKWQECFPTSHILVKEYEECAEEIGYDNTLQPKVTGVTKYGSICTCGCFCPLLHALIERPLTVLLERMDFQQAATAATTTARPPGYGSCSPSASSSLSFAAAQYALGLLIGTRRKNRKSKSTGTTTTTQDGARHSSRVVRQTIGSSRTPRAHEARSTREKNAEEQPVNYI